MSQTPSRNNGEGSSSGHLRTPKAPKKQLKRKRVVLVDLTQSPTSNLTIKVEKKRKTSEGCQSNPIVLCKTVYAEDRCAFCWEDVEIGEEAEREWVNCVHCTKNFHADCAKQWKDGKECSLCRQKMSLEDEDENDNNILFKPSPGSKSAVALTVGTTGKARRFWACVQTSEINFSQFTSTSVCHDKVIRPRNVVDFCEKVLFPTFVSQCSAAKALAGKRKRKRVYSSEDDSEIEVVCSDEEEVSQPRKRKRVAKKALGKRPAAAPKKKMPFKKRPKKKRGNKSNGPECGVCLFCKDKTKNGGPDKLRQKCVMKTALAAGMSLDDISSVVNKLKDDKEDTPPAITVSCDESLAGGIKTVAPASSSSSSASSPVPPTTALTVSPASEDTGLFVEGATMVMNAPGKKVDGKKVKVVQPPTPSGKVTVKMVDEDRVIKVKKDNLRKVEGDENESGVDELTDEEDFGVELKSTSTCLLEEEKDGEKKDEEKKDEEKKDEEEKDEEKKDEEKKEEAVAAKEGEAKKSE